MAWLKNFISDMRFLARHSRRICKVLIRNRMGYRRILSKLRELELQPEKQSIHKRHQESWLKHESALLGRKANFIGEATINRQLARHNQSNDNSRRG